MNEEDKKLMADEDHDLLEFMFKDKDKDQEQNNTSSISISEKKVDFDEDEENRSNSTTPTPENDDVEIVGLNMLSPISKMKILDETSDDKNGNGDFTTDALDKFLGALNDDDAAKNNDNMIQEIDLMSFKSLSIDLKSTKL